MRKSVYLFLAIIIAAGIAVYWWSSTGAQADRQTETRVAPQRKSKAFQYMVDAARSRSEKRPGGGTETKPEDRATAKSKLETINRFREIGWELFSRQRDYLASIEDPAARNEADIVFTTANQLMLAAVLAEMSKSKEYSEHLINMLQEEGLRWYIVHGLSQYFPALSKHIEQGGQIDAGNLATLFSGDRDILSEFDTRIASKVSAGEAAAFETGVAHFIAAEVLAWQAVHSGELDKRSQPTPFWEATYREREVK